MRAVEELLQLAPDLHDIAVVGAEPHPDYDRVLLSKQGKVVATHLAQFGIGRYTGTQTSTKLKVRGIDLFAAGNLTRRRACSRWTRCAGTPRRARVAVRAPVSSSNR